MNFDLYAVETLADRRRLDLDHFDRQLPFEIANGVRLEDVSALIPPRAFDLVRETEGTRLVETLSNVHYALVHRYNGAQLLLDRAPWVINTHEIRQRSERLVAEVATCLRLIRPTRQRVARIHGNILEDGTFDVMGFDHPHPLNLLDVPENQRLFKIRNEDLDLLRALAPEFLRAMSGEFWKFKMAVQFYDLAHFEQRHWKIRYMLFASAIEAIYTSALRGNKGSLVATERIKWFLGERTSVYPPGELFDREEDPRIDVGSVVGALYEVRNMIAHGDRIPDSFFNDCARQGVGGPINKLDMLTEACSFLIRASLLKILREGLLDHFRSAESSTEYFRAQGLTEAQINAKSSGRGQATRMPQNA